MILTISDTNDKNMNLLNLSGNIFYISYIMEDSKDIFSFGAHFFKESKAGEWGGDQ